MDIFNLLIVIAWAIFILVWFVFAFKAKKTTNYNIVRRFGLRILIVVVAVLLLRISAVKDFLAAHEAAATVHATNPILGTIGVICAVLGIGFAIWARVHLGRNWGMPRSIKENPELVTSGPYTYVRNPIYTGIILAMIGSAFATGFFWLVIAVIASVYFIYSAKVEEKIMQNTFPDTYPAYKERTKMLIPFVI